MKRDEKSIYSLLCSNQEEFHELGKLYLAQMSYEDRVIFFGEILEMIVQGKTTTRLRKDDADLIEAFSIKVLNQDLIIAIKKFTWKNLTKSYQVKYIFKEKLQMVFEILHGKSIMTLVEMSSSRFYNTNMLISWPKNKIIEYLTDTILL